MKCYNVMEYYTYENGNDGVRFAGPRFTTEHEVLHRQPEYHGMSIMYVRNAMKDLGDIMGFELLDKYLHLPYDLLSKFADDLEHGDKIYKHLQDLDAHVEIMSGAYKQR